jgi:hypothetical protein
MYFFKFLSLKESRPSWEVISVRVERVVLKNKKESAAGQEVPTLSP